MYDSTSKATNNNVTNNQHIKQCPSQNKQTAVVQSHINPKNIFNSSSTKLGQMIHIPKKESQSYMEP